MADLFTESKKWLCVAMPAIGRPSETFLRQHANCIAPGETVVVTEMGRIENAAWTVDGPWIKAGSFSRTAACPSQRLHPRVQSQLAVALRKHGVRCILSEYLDHTLPLIPLAKDLGIPLVAHAHGYDVSERLRNTDWVSDYQKLNDCDAIVAVSDSSRKRLVSIGISPELVHVIACCPEVMACALSRESLDPPRLLAVGRMVGKKAPLVVLESFRHLLADFPTAELHYVGDGPLLPAAIQFVRLFGMEERVTFYGALDAANVARAFLQSDIFVQHSCTDPVNGDQEGLPVAILEAMSYGLPVIATRHAGIPEVITHGETGLLTDEWDSKAMTAGMKLLITDLELRRKLVQNARVICEERYAWSGERARLLTLLAGLGNRAG